jgi:hypothetical protein
MFMESLTPAGMDKARKAISDRLTAPAKKPWWQFWSSTEHAEPGSAAAVGSTTAFRDVSLPNLSKK